MVTNEFLNSEKLISMRMRNSFAVNIQAVMNEHCEYFCSSNLKNFTPALVFFPDSTKTLREYAIAVFRYTEADETMYRFHVVDVYSDKKFALNELLEQTRSAAYVTVADKFLKDSKMSLREYSEWFCAASLTEMRLF